MMHWMPPNKAAPQSTSGPFFQLKVTKLPLKIAFYFQWVVNKSFMRHLRKIDFRGGGGMCLQEELDEYWTGKKEKTDRSVRIEEDEWAFKVISVVFLFFDKQ